MINIRNTFFLLLILIIIIYMMFIVYKCKIIDNIVIIEKYYKYYNPKKYEKFINYDTKKYNTTTNSCINNWINNNSGMEGYLKGIDKNTRDIIIETVSNVECSKK